jgi:hypothetical protein
MEGTYTRPFWDSRLLSHFCYFQICNSPCRELTCSEVSSILVALRSARLRVNNCVLSMTLLPNWNDIYSAHKWRRLAPRICQIQICCLFFSGKEDAINDSLFFGAFIYARWLGRKSSTFRLFVLSSFLAVQRFSVLRGHSPLLLPWLGLIDPPWP